jgi:tRNA(Ile)-lysidine synthase TilS/MesJ
MLVQKVKRTIGKYGMLAPGDGVVVAVPTRSAS